MGKPIRPRPTNPMRVTRGTLVHLLAVAGGPRTGRGRLLELAGLRKGDDGLHRQMVTGVLALIAVGVGGGVTGDDVG